MLLAWLAAIGISLSPSGYLKELWQYSHSALDDRPYYLNTGRARLTLDGTAWTYLKGHVDYDHTLVAGSYFRTPEYRLLGLNEPDNFLMMYQTIRRTPTSVWRQSLYRGWLGMETEKTVLRFGRQRIAWGTGKIWNPTDILNPYHPTTVERDERAGVDVLYLRRAAGDLTQFEAAYAPEVNWAKTALLARGKLNWKGFDFSLMGGKAAASTGSWITGGDFAGNLGQGSLHGEWSYTDLRTQRPFWKGLLGYDYTFPSDAPLQAVLKDAATTIEYLHSGAGTTDVFRYNPTDLLTGRQVTLGKDYVGATYSKDLHSLLKLDWSILANLDDLSHFFGPSLQFNALPNLYLSAGWQRFGGGTATEFGRAPNVSYLQAQYYF